MGVDFQLTRKQAEGRPEVIIFELSGWLDAQGEPQLVEAVQRATNEGAGFILLDLKAVDTINSSGIRAIQRSYEILTPRGTDPKPVRLKLCNASPQVYEVLTVTGVLRSVPVFESQDIAVDSFA